MFYLNIDSEKIEYESDDCFHEGNWEREQGF